MAEKSPTTSLCPPTADYRGLLRGLSFLPCIKSGTWLRSCTAHTHTRTHRRDAHHGSYPQRIQRVPAEHRRHGGRAAPLSLGAEFGVHIPAAPIRDPRCHGIAPSGLQRGDLVTPDRLSARGRVTTAAFFDCNAVSTFKPNPASDPCVNTDLTGENFSLPRWLDALVEIYAILLRHKNAR